MPVRHTSGSAASAACRVAASAWPAASASAKTAGAFLGARPLRLTSAMRATVRAPSAARHSSTVRALSWVIAFSEA